MILTPALSSDRFNDRNSPFWVFPPSVLQTLQTTDPGAEREPPENHAKVRRTAVCVREEGRGKMEEQNLILHASLGAAVMQRRCFIILLSVRLLSQVSR